MKRILTVLLPVVIALLQGSARTVAAEQPSTSLELHLKPSRKLPAADPLPQAGIVERDVQQAVAEMKARERRDELIRESMRSGFRRPDLDPAVVGGIQSRSLSDALRRR